MSNKEYFEMASKHIVDADPKNRERWAIALLLRESGLYRTVSVGFREIIVCECEGNCQNYKCSIKLHNWQKKAIKGLLVDPIIVVLNHKEMTADILKSKFARYTSVARKVVSGLQAK